MLHVDERRGADRRYGGSMIVDVQVEDAAAEHRRLGSLGVPLTPLIDQPWGERNFTLTDPDGYGWFIGQQLRGAA